MSDLSVLERQLLGGVHSVLTHLVNASALDPATKAEANDTLSNISAAVSQMNSTVSEAAQGVVNTEAATVEGVAGKAVEEAADSVIEKALPAPVAPTAEAAANALLEAVGGDLQTALNHLLNIKPAA